jgi:sugar phosphate isomerase/epimerase
MIDRQAFDDRIAISGTEYPYRPLTEVLDVATHLDVRELELWIPHNFAFQDLASVEGQLSDRGLHAAVISTWTQLNLPGDVKPRQLLIHQSIEAANVLGARSVNTYFGAHPTRTAKESIRAYREYIMPLVEFAEKSGVYITLENEFEATGRDVTRTAEGVCGVIEAVNSPFFKVNFDPCNFYFSGEEPYPYAYALLKDHIGYIHLKDGMKYHPDLYPDPGEGFLWKDLSGEYVCCTIGAGAINYEPLILEIANSHYDGYLALEPHVHPTFLLPTFQQSLNFIRQRLLNKHQGEPQ